MLKNILSPLFNSLKKPKWQHSNPKTRKQGILESLEPGHPELENIAINDTDTDVQITAIKRITSLDSIQQVIKLTSDLNKTAEEVSKVAQQHLARMLSGETFPLADIVDRLEVIRGHIPSKICDYVAEHAKEEELRLIILEKVKRDALLGDISLKDSSQAVRLKAIQFINKKSTLQRICKQSRNKNKRVHHAAKEKLDKLIDDDNRPQLNAAETKSICENLEKLFKRQLLKQEEHTFAQLTHQWEDVKNFASRATTERFDSIVEKINLSIEKLTQKEENENQLIEEFNQTLEQLSSLVNTFLEKQTENTDEKNKIQSQIEEIKHQWQEKIEQVSSNAKEKLDKEYHAILDLISTKAEEPENTQYSVDVEQHINRLNIYIDQAQGILSKSQYSGKKLVDTLISKTEKILLTLKTSIEVNEDTDVKQEFKQLEQRYEQTKLELLVFVDNQQVKKSELLAKIEKIKGEISEFISQGDTLNAQKLRTKYQQLVNSSKSLSELEKQALLELIQESNQQLSHLSSWKNWAAERERGNLCERAQTILIKIKESLSVAEDSAAIYQDYSGQIKGLRQEWKQLKGRSDDKTWEKFNQCCNQSFELFAPYLEKQSEIRLANTQKKEDLCQQLENYIQHMQWSELGLHKQDSTENVSTPINKLSTNKDTDWKQVDTILKQAKKEWHAIGPSNRDNYKKLSAQFKKLISTIEKQLHQAWDDNAEHFSLLITNAEKLEELMLKDLSMAIKECKSLQADWKKIGPTHQRQRKVLWKKFRSACDKVFAKRDEKQEIKKQEDESIELEKVALCENLEALLAQQQKQNMSLEALKTAYNDIQNLWNGYHKSKDNPLTQRFNQAVSNYKAAIDDIKKLAIEEQKVLLQTKVKLCTSIEQSESEVNIEQAQTDWDKTAPLKMDKLNKAINQRFAKALEQTNSKLDDDRLSQVLLEKEELCLAIEVVMGKESPKDKAKQRMAFQVEQLNKKMGDKETDLSSDQLVEAWYQLPEYKQHSELKERFFGVAKSR